MSVKSHGSSSTSGGGGGGGEDDGGGGGERGGGADDSGKPKSRYKWVDVDAHSLSRPETRMTKEEAAGIMEKTGIITGGCAALTYFTDALKRTIAAVAESKRKHRQKRNSTGNAINLMPWLTFHTASRHLPEPPPLPQSCTVRTTSNRPAQETESEGGGCGRSFT